MTLEQIIELFKEIESGKEGQKLGYHLHRAIHQANSQDWPTNQNYGDRFSSFLEALKEEGSQ